MQYYQRLKDIREDNDKKQSDVADFLKIDRSYYGKYERGLHPIPVEYIIQLCYYYNVTADYLLGLIDEPRPLK